MIRALFGLLAIIVIGGGAYYFMQQNSSTSDPLQSSDSVTTTQQAQIATCDGRDPRDPYILSISPDVGSKGSKVIISGCNLSGFEGDLIATFVRSDGAVVSLNGGHYSRKTPDVAESTSMTVTMDTYCPTGSIVGAYSGIDTPCKTVEATPGVYTVLVETPEGKSNSVPFTLR